MESCIKTNKKIALLLTEVTACLLTSPTPLAADIAILCRFCTCINIYVHMFFEIRKARNGWFWKNDKNFAWKGKYLVKLQYLENIQVLMDTFAKTI